MGHPTRFLTDYVAGELGPVRQRAIEKHLLRCRQCSLAVEQEAAVRHRLQTSATPDPSADLCDRILLRATDDQSAAGGPSTRPGSERESAHRILSPSFAHRHRTALAIGGGMAVVTAATLTAAYALGSEVQPEEFVAAGGTAAVSNSWETIAAQTPVSLSEPEIDQLRDDGWFCPELKTMGFDLVGAEALTVDGRPTLQLKLDDGEHTLTIFEQRGQSSGAADATPVNGSTGNTVVEDGFEEVGGTQRTVWVHPGRSWQLVIDSGSVTYTVVSTLPIADMPRTVSQLMLTEHSQLAYSRPDTPDDPLSRILRGLEKLAQPSP
ncbi:hypothetical protein GCM10027403_27850 [Arthrobacter tecti]